MTLEDFQTPIHCKLQGTRNLINALDGPTSESQVAFFLLLSSVTGVIGSRGQANYAAAGTCLDALAQSRRGTRTKYISLDIGMLEDAEVNDEVVVRNLSSQGLTLVKQSELAIMLEYAMSMGQAQDDHCQIVSGFDGQSLSKATQFNAPTQHPLFSHVRQPVEKIIGEQAEVQQAPFQDLLKKETDRAGIERVATTLLVAKVSDMVAFGDRQTSPSMSLTEVGLDSLITIELRDWIIKEFRSSLTTAEILDHTSFRALAQTIVARSTLVQRTTNEPFAENEDGVRESKPLDVPASKTTKLPKQPLPDLQSSLDQLIESRKPFISPEECSRFEKITQTFAVDSGAKLQNQLLDRANDPKVESWQGDLYMDKVYLSRRDPIQPNVIFYGGHLVSPDICHGQARRAAIISWAAFEFKQGFEAGDIQPDVLTHDEPLCTNSWKWLFNACREPHKVCDRVQHHPGHDYVIALRRGHIFRIELKHQDGADASVDDLEASFETVMSSSLESVSAAAALTADARDPWAEVSHQVAE